MQRAHFCYRNIVILVRIKPKRICLLRHFCKSAMFLANLLQRKCVSGENLARNLSFFSTRNSTDFNLVNSWAKIVHLWNLFSWSTMVRENSEVKSFWIFRKIFLCLLIWNQTKSWKAITTPILTIFDHFWGFFENLVNYRKTFTYIFVALNLSQNVSL